MGRITLLLGCMFAQKTTELLRRIRQYKSIGYHVLIVNFFSDQRYGKDCIASHDKDSEKAVCIDNLTTLEGIVHNYDVMVIDEGQFFGNLYECVTRWADELPIHIVVAGLSGDSNRNPFGDMLRLIPHAEEIEHLTALCGICKDGTPAIYSKRITDETELVTIGGAERFQPVCRAHYCTF
jgi:thymidine kinase